MHRRRWIVLMVLVAALPAMPGGAEGQQRMHPTAVITMDKGGEIRIELYPEDAPKTVESFITLSKKGFYDGLTFHRVVPGFVAQGGIRRATGPAARAIRSRPSSTSGSMSAGPWPWPAPSLRTRRGASSTSASAPAPHLDNNYTVFGQVTSGLGRGRPHQAGRQDEEREDRGAQALTENPARPAAPDTRRA